MIRMIDFNTAEPTCYRTKFRYSSSGQQNGAFWYIVLRVMLLIYTQDIIQFSNCDRLSLMTQVDDTNIDLPDLEPVPDVLESIAISRQDVEDVLRHFNASKASRLDLISPAV